MPALDSLYQYIVPLAFIAIWALTSLFNRESQPLPPRVGRPTDPNGLRPPGPAGREASASRSPVPGSLGPPRPNRRQDDDILIIEAEPRRPSPTSPARAGVPASRRVLKARQSGQSKPRQPEPPTPRGLSALLTHPEKPPDIHAQALKPLSLPPSPLLTTPNDEAAKTQAGRARASQLDSFSSEEIRAFVQNPARLREGFILGELLKPPLALRGGPFVPRHRPSGS